jgi:hypothetical protein
MGFALVTAVGWGLNWPVSKYLLTELPLLSTLKQGTIQSAEGDGITVRKDPQRPRPSGCLFIQMTLCVAALRQCPLLALSGHPRALN